MDALVRGKRVDPGRLISSMGGTPPNKAPPPAPTKPNQPGKVLIVFAWAMETVGVTAGVLNSAYVTFGGNFPSSFATLKSLC